MGIVIVHPGGIVVEFGHGGLGSFSEGGLFSGDVAVDDAFPGGRMGGFVMAVVVVVVGVVVEAGESFDCFAFFAGVESVG